MVVVVLGGGICGRRRRMRDRGRNGVGVGTGHVLGWATWKDVNLEMIEWLWVKESVG